MNEFKLNGNMTVAAVKDLFKTLTGGTLRVKDGGKKADESATIASISKGKNTNGVMQLNAEMTIGDFKSKMFSDFGLKVDVGTPDDWVSVPNGIILGQLRSLPKNAVKAQLEAMVGAKAENGFKETVLDDYYPTYEECCAKYEPNPKANLVKYSNDGKVLKEIGSNFEGPLIIPDGVETLVNQCRSDNVTAIVMPDSVVNLETFDIFGFKVHFLRMPRGLTEIPPKTFTFLSVTELQFPEGLRVIGEVNFNAWEIGCLHVKFPSTLEYILGQTFQHNDFQEIIIPANVKAIFPGAFDDNQILKKVIFMSDETVVLPGAFDDCPLIDSKAIYKAHQLGDRILGADEVLYDGDVLTYIPPYYCGKLVVKDGTKKISSDINLWQLKGITELYLPDSLDYNGTYPKYVTKLRSSNNTNEFSLCSNNYIQLFYWPRNVSKIYFDDSLYYFENLDIPDSVTEIEHFESMKGLKSISIPNSVTKINEKSFSDLPALTSIKIPEKIKRIENGCFSNTGVKHIDLPSGLKEIGNGAFSDNTSLEEIIIPASVEIIEEDAFSGCTSLKKITIEGDPIIRKGAFHNCPGW